MDEKIIRILKNNPWLNGSIDTEEGDILAGIERRGKFAKITEVKDIKELYTLLRNYDGAFKYKKLVFFNDYNYGCFVYDIDKPDSYVEHFTMSMSFEKFKEAVQELLKSS